MTNIGRKKLNFCRCSARLDFFSECLTTLCRKVFSSSCYNGTISVIHMRLYFPRGIHCVIFPVVVPSPSLYGYEKESQEDEVQEDDDEEEKEEQDVTSQNPVRIERGFFVYSFQVQKIRIHNFRLRMQFFDHRQSNTLPLPEKTCNIFLYETFVSVDRAGVAQYQCTPQFPILKLHVLR